MTTMCTACFTAAVTPSHPIHHNLPPGTSLLWERECLLWHAFICRRDRNYGGSRSGRYDDRGYGRSSRHREYQFEEGEHRGGRVGGSCTLHVKQLLRVLPPSLSSNQRFALAGRPPPVMTAGGGWCLPNH